MQRILVIFFLFIIPLTGFAQFEQYIQQDPEPTSNNRAGGAFSLLENGSGLGGFVEWSLPNFYQVGGALTFYMLRDNKQIEAYDPYYNAQYTIGKVNNAYLIDLGFILKKRLFAREIDDQFRPFISTAVGPIFGMNFPEKESKKPDEYRWALSAAVAAGVDVVMDTGYLIGFQLQYRLMRFDGILAEIDKGNFSTLDVRIEIGKLF